MMSARTKILKHIWETGGGYINSCGSVTLITRLSIKDAGLYVDVGSITIEKTIHRGKNVAILRGLVSSRGRVQFGTLITGICIDNRFYTPVNKTFVTTRLPNGALKDTYTIAMIEQYTDDDKPSKTKK